MRGRDAAVAAFVKSGTEDNFARMPRKRKKKTFTAAKAVREMARERVGTPKPSNLIATKKSKPEKHTATLGKLLQEE
jgi:hypothetical protein